ncbi:MAG TPA: phosphomannomutase/phosphoglucomutase [Thermomicrobiales bacterium]|jgi:phosphomannomutase|nr:phosphomannomutase/phosphoglucomutase [Thermomicrobiales bacterium]
MTDNAVISSLFKAYDIRGLVPEELTPDTAYKVGRALVAYLQVDAVAVGRDMRTSGEMLSAALIDGIRDSGADVTDIGLVSTDALYFAVGRFGYPAGVMITASHNPAGYNGFKICRDQARALSMDEGIGQIRDLVVANDFGAPADKRGDLLTRDVLSDYADFMLSQIDVSAIRPLKVAIDAGNGMAGRMTPAVFDRLPIEVVPLYFELDGTFPNHEANPIEPENTEELRRVVVEQGCDLGVAFDGDADRMFLIDERGQFIGGDMTTAMVTVSMLGQHPGASIVYNLVCSRAVPETIERLGGTPIRSRVGHSFIKALMREHDAIFGGEHSGHFYFRDNWYADSGLLACLKVLELLSNANQPVSQVLAPLDPRARSGEINTEVRDAKATLRRVEDHYAAAGATIDHLDGLTIGFPDWWFSLRSSNTQPLLRLNVETDDPAQIQARTAEVMALFEA